MTTRRGQPPQAPSTARHDDDDNDNDNDNDDERKECLMLDAAEAGEEIPSDADEPMESEGSEADGAHEAGGDGAADEMLVANDSVAHFAHADSIFCITQHPLHPELIATGGGDDLAYLFDSTPAEGPVPPAGSWANSRAALAPQARFDGHTDSISAIAFTAPRGEYLVTAGMDGRVRAYQDTSAAAGPGHGRWTGAALVAEAQEVQEMNWMAACPHPQHPNTLALGAADGSVWVYTVDGGRAEAEAGLAIVQVYYLHTASCTAGAWTPDGALLATVSEDGSLYVHDVFGELAAASGAGGRSQAAPAPSVVALTAQDQRFAVPGGLFSVAVSPTEAFLVVGGAGGHIRVVSLPRKGSSSSSSGQEDADHSSTTATSKANANAKAKSKIKAAGAPAGQILASIKAQDDSVETLAFSTGPIALLAAGSVDGSIVLFDTTRRFEIRRHIARAHGDAAVVKLAFVPGRAGAPDTSASWLLTSAGMDGVLRRWDTRGGGASAASASAAALAPVAAGGPPAGLVHEWRGHRGMAEGGGILAFVQGGGGERIVTAGDDGLSLVFDAPIA